MPRKLNKEEMNDEIYRLWFSRLCAFGAKQAKKMLFEAYKELRRQENERKIENGNN